jgi:CDP-diacylglycerol---glycerol-3-phosphate 3-phosphatidyltransferase
VNLPIIIVLARGLATIPVLALLALATPETDAVALAVFAVAVLSDAVDGRLARARGEVTTLGAALDPLADKVLVVGTLGGLALRGLVPAWALLTIAVREIGAIVLRARSPRPLPASPDGKAKSVLQVLAATGLILAAATRSEGTAVAATAVLLAAVALTVVSGVKLLLRALQTTPDAA